jgi:hypothetical protein
MALGLRLRPIQGNYARVGTPVDDIDQRDGVTITPGAGWGSRVHVEHSIIAAHLRPVRVPHHDDIDVLTPDDIGRDMHHQESDSGDDHALNRPEAEHRKR